MPILPFQKTGKANVPSGSHAGLLDGCSIEVMPRTAAKIEDFRAILPAGTRVYIAHIEGTPIDDMVATARRLRDEGFTVMPHFPARNIRDTAELKDWITRYREDADVREALVLAGGAGTPAGNLTDSLQLLETGYFEDAGFTRLHVAGHPEGNRDVDPDGGTSGVDAALARKQAHAEATTADMAIVTQFAFDAPRCVEWAGRLRGMGITMPIHLGIAGPAKLQTLLKFAIACGVGPSLSVLQKRAKDVTKLLLPYEPDDFLTALSGADGRPFEQLHIFPLGGIAATANYLARQTPRPAAVNGDRDS